MTRRTAARIARHVADVFAECRYAQRRMMILNATPDRYLADPDQAPATYAEFLFRTSAPLTHEPAATGRARGRTVG
jgi:hypothetical protein